MEIRLIRLRALLPIASLALTFVIADKIRRMAGVSAIPALQAVAPNELFNDLSATFSASAQEWNGRLAWAGPLAVSSCLWTATMWACLATVHRLTPAAHRIKWGAFFAFAIVVCTIRFGSGHLQGFLIASGEHVALVAIILLAGALALGSTTAIVLSMATLLIGIFLWICNGWPVAGWQGAGPITTVNRQLAMIAPPFDELILTKENQCGILRAGPCFQGLPGLDRVVGGFDLMAVALLALAISMIIAEDPFCSSDKQQAANRLARQQEQMQRLLYLSAALLAMSILFAKSYQAWPLATLRDANLKSAFQSIAETWLMLSGTYWTLILAAVFLPLGLMLRQRCATLALLHCGSQLPKAQSDWLLAAGYNFSLREQFLSVISLLAPWIAGGPLGAILSGLKPAAS